MKSSKCPFSRFPRIIHCATLPMRIVTYQQVDPAVVSLFCSETQRQTGALRYWKGVLNLNNKHFCAKSDTTLRFELKDERDVKNIN